jgi:RND family efflux transporter MFP subunit
MILRALLALMSVAIVLLLVLKKPVQETAQPPEKPVAVRTLTLQARDVAETVAIPGRIEACTVVDVAIEKPGRIVELSVREGARVRKGDALLKVDDRAWRDQLQNATIQKNDAERDYARWAEMKRTGAVSASDFDAVERRREMADVAVSQAGTAVSQCAIVSPSDGMVDARFVEVGDYGTEGRVALRIVNIDRVKLTLDIPERDVLSLRVGATVVFQAGVPEPAAFTGAVTFVAAAASPESNSYRADILVDNPGHLLRPGVIVEVPLTRRVLHDAVVVPLTAVIPRKGDHFVFLAEGQRAAMRRVKIEALLENEAVLREGARAGDILVTEGQRMLQDGALLSVVN